MGTIPPQLQAFILESWAGSPPPGVERGLDNRPSLSFQGYIDASVCTAVASIVFFISLYTKCFVLRKFRASDYVLLLSYCLYLVFIAFVYRYTAQGLYHQWDVKVRELSFYLWYIRLIGIAYYSTLALVKVAICLQYIQVFSPVKRQAFYWSCVFMASFSALYSLVGVLIHIFQCRPMRRSYDPLLHITGEGSCIDLNAFYVSTAAINVLVDFVLLLMPQKIIWDLQLTTRRKLGISAMFAVGLLACFSSIMRLYHTIPALHAKDMLMGSANIGFWLVPELACGILIVALPVLPRFFRSFQNSSSMPGSVSLFRSHGSGEKNLRARWVPKSLASRTGDNQLDETSSINSENSVPYHQDKSRGMPVHRNNQAYFHEKPLPFPPNQPLRETGLQPQVWSPIRSNGWTHS